MKRSMKIAVIAGEASGDQLGGTILRALKPLVNMDLMGVGGPQMAAQGLNSLFDYTDLSVMGLVEILGRYGQLRARVQQTVRAVCAAQPDMVLTIDAPEFAKAVVSRLRPQLPHTKFIHVVAPTVWAWRPGRAKIYARLYDHLLCLFPFEPPFFDAVGLPAHFIGHPALDEIEFNLDRGARPPHRILILPGSRRQEIKRLLPLFIQSIQCINDEFKDHALTFELLTLPHLEPLVRGYLPLDFPVTVHTDISEKNSLFAQSDLALAASGTVGLELALAGIPHIIAYKIHPLTHFIVKHMIRTPYVHLANVILGHKVVPELLQGQATVDTITAAMRALINDPAARDMQIHDFGLLRQRLSLPLPSAHAAAAVLADC